MPILKCLECGGEMEEGFLLDRGHGNSANVESWIEGEPQRAWYGLKTRGKTRFAVETYRCARCGLLKSYAPEANV